MPLLRTEQVALNLLSNAVKFSGSEGRAGRVHVRLLRVPLAPSSGSCTSPADVTSTLSHAARTPHTAAGTLNPVAVRIEVEDNGSGVPEGVAARLITPFTQADSSTTRRFGGTGLGLSICRGLTELMGGRIGVNSPNALGGATFWVELLLDTPAPCEALPPPAALVIAETPDRGAATSSAPLLTGPHPPPTLAFATTHARARICVYFMWGIDHIGINAAFRVLFLQWSSKTIKLIAS